MINILDIIRLQFSCTNELLADKFLLGMLDKDLSLIPERLAVYIYRLQNEIIKAFGEKNAKEILQILSYIQRIYTQIEIYYSAVIGDNLTIVHGLGTVIGARVVIGNNVTIYQNVTLGDKGDGTCARPVIGDNTVIGVGSIILGGITIGKNCIIGANSVVLESFPDSSVIVGVPARLLKRR